MVKLFPLRFFSYKRQHLPKNEISTPNQQSAQRDYANIKHTFPQGTTCKMQKQK